MHHRSTLVSQSYIPLQVLYPIRASHSARFRGFVLFFSFPVVRNLQRSYSLILPSTVIRVGWHYIYSQYTKSKCVFMLRVFCVILYLFTSMVVFLGLLGCTTVKRIHSGGASVVFLSF